MHNVEKRRINVITCLPAGRLVNMIMQKPGSQPFVTLASSGLSNWQISQ
jgi:hypothetical protein